VVDSTSTLTVGMSGFSGGTVARSHTSFVSSTTTLANLPRWRKASDRLFIDACIGRRVSWARCDTLVRLTCPLPDRW
jgi:hypothetical protein